MDEHYEKWPRFPHDEWHEWHGEPVTIDLEGTIDTDLLRKALGLDADTEMVTWTWRGKSKRESRYPNVRVTYEFSPDGMWTMKLAGPQQEVEQLAAELAAYYGQPTNVDGSNQLVTPDHVGD